MILSDIGMILAPTVRSNAYLQVLLNNDIIPNHIILLGNQEQTKILELISDEAISSLNKTDILKYFKIDVSIIELLIQNNIDFSFNNTLDINSDEIIDKTKNRSEKYFVYSGIGGAIIGKVLLNCGKKIIHIHSGRVPDYRGSTTIYYQILNEQKCYASAFFLNETIDTGPLIKIKEYPKPENGIIIDYVYDSFIRADLLLEVLQEYNKNKCFTHTNIDNSIKETYFIIHPVLKHLSILSCNNSNITD